MRQQHKKQAFLQGALILICANVLVKLIGAVFKIPLTYLIGEDGMGLFSSSYMIYTVMFIVATAGFPTAVSKMVAESIARGKRREADRIFHVAVIILASIGVVGSLVLFFGSDLIARMMHNSRAAWSIQAIAPAVLCVALMAAFRGYFQGQQNMYPTAVSEVIEALGKLVFGYLLAWYFMHECVEKAAAGAVFGVTMGTFLGFLSLLAVFVIRKREKTRYLPELTRSYRQIAKELVWIAVPITIGASVSSLTNLADMFTVMNRLQTITQATPEFIEKYASLIDPSVFSGAVYEKLANSLYGLYTSYAVTLFNLPLTIVVALAMSIVPAIAGAITRGDAASAQRSTAGAIKITVLFAVPCAIGMSVLAEPILLLVFQNGLAASMLQKLAVAIIFVSVLQVTSAVLQAHGRTVIPVVNMFIGGIVKVVINYNLVAVPGINIDGAPIGTLVCYFVITVLNMYWIVRVTKCRFGIVDFLLKPLLAGGIMGAAAYFGYGLVAGLGNRIATVVTIVGAAVVYVVVLVCLRALRREDFAMLPKGDKIAGFLEKLHLL